MLDRIRRPMGGTAAASTIDAILLATFIIIYYISACVAADSTAAAISSGAVSCDPTKHGASPASKDNTAAIQAALDECATSGGTVSLQGGVFRSGPLVVHGTGVTLEVASGAGLTMAFPPSSWPRTSSSSIGRQMVGQYNNSSSGYSQSSDVNSSGAYVTVLTFSNCMSCTLTGGGVLNGRGARPPEGDDWYYLFDQGKLEAGRPNYLRVEGGRDFTLSGSLTLLNAPQFNVALDGVVGAEISGLNITSNWYVDPKSGELKEPHNTDGIDPGGGSSNVHIHDVYIHNGDDSVAVKPHSSPACTRNILVEDAHFEYGHGASIGSVGSGCVENVVFRRITMAHQENGARVKSYSSSEGGGYVRNITWESIVLSDTDDCITVNDAYKKPPPNAKYHIAVNGLTFSNITGSGCGGDADVSFVCPAASPCTGIVLDNVQLSGKDGKARPMVCENARGSAIGTVVPKSCLGGGPSPPSPPSPSPPSPPSPSPPSPPSPPGCNVQACFARCVARYGGTIATQSYDCAKGCASMKDGKVGDINKYCKLDPSHRFSACEKSCKDASGNKAGVEQCEYGCGYWHT